MPTFLDLPQEVMLMILERANTSEDLVSLCDSHPSLRALFKQYGSQITDSVCRNCPKKAPQRYTRIVNAKAGIEVVKSELVPIEGGKQLVMYNPRVDDSVPKLDRLSTIRACLKLDVEIQAIVYLCMGQLRGGFSHLLIRRGLDKIRQNYLNAVTILVYLTTLITTMGDFITEPDERGEVRFNRIAEGSADESKRHRLKQPLCKAKVCAAIQNLDIMTDFYDLLAVGDCLIIIRACMKPISAIHYKMRELKNNKTFLSLCDGQRSKELWSSRLLAYAWILIYDHIDRDESLAISYDTAIREVFRSLRRYIKRRPRFSMREPARDDSSDDDEIPALPIKRCDSPLGVLHCATPRYDPPKLRRLPRHLRIDLSDLVGDTDAIIQRALGY